MKFEDIPNYSFFTIPYSDTRCLDTNCSIFQKAVIKDDIFRGRWIWDKRKDVYVSEPGFSCIMNNNTECHIVRSSKKMETYKRIKQEPMI